MLVWRLQRPILFKFLPLFYIKVQKASAFHSRIHFKPNPSLEVRQEIAVHTWITNICLQIHPIFMWVKMFCYIKRTSLLSQSITFTQEQFNSIGNSLPLYISCLIYYPLSCLPSILFSLVLSFSLLFSLVLSFSLLFSLVLSFPLSLSLSYISSLSSCLIFVSLPLFYCLVFLILSPV